MSEPMARNSLAKKVLALIGIVFSLFMVVTPFIPFYSAPTGVEEKPFVYVNLLHYYDYVKTGKAIAFIVIGSLSALICVFAAIMLLRCVLAAPQTDDKEDKFFVFGFAIFALSTAMYGAICFSSSAFLAMFIGLGLALLGIIAIIVHFKVLSDI